jgi:hypothetical protein
MTRINAWLCAALVMVPAVAAAQQPTQPSTSGPMVVEPVESGFLIAPDFKVTRMDRTTGDLAGVYGGWVLDNSLLIGAGGYWMTNGSRQRDMSYGGLVVQWLGQTDGPVGFGVGSLIGFGDAKLTGTETFYVPGPTRQSPLVPTTLNVTFRRQFFVFEPQAAAHVTMTRHLRLSLGAGYRLTGGAEGVEGRLRGATGSVAFQIH